MIELLAAVLLVAWYVLGVRRVKRASREKTALYLKHLAEFNQRKG